MLPAFLPPAAHLRDPPDDSSGDDLCPLHLDLQLQQHGVQVLVVCEPMGLPWPRRRLIPPPHPLPILQWTLKTAALSAMGR